MNMNVPPLLSAPQVTGHLQGLPGDRPDPSERTRIQPIAEARNPEARLKDGLAPTKFWRAANGEPDPSTNAAPPSIMQITITRMLDEQSRPDAARIAPDTGADPAERGDAARKKAPLPPTPPVSADPDQSAAAKEARSSVFSTLP